MGGKPHCYSGEVALYKAGNLVYRRVLIFLEMCGAHQQKNAGFKGRERRNVKMFHFQPKSLGSEAGSASSAPFLIALHLACS